jgi:hypothetical protein
MSESMVRLAIDFENPATEWWENGGRALWEAVAEGFDTSAALVPRDIAESWLVQASQLPGWDAGPEHSPHPVRLVEVDEDEVL